MIYTAFAVFFLVGFFTLILLSLFLGYHISLRQSVKYPGNKSQGFQLVASSVFALMGLLVAFTFSSAGIKFDTVRKMIIEEANAIGTAWYRLDLLDSEAQIKARKYFSEFIDTRLQAYSVVPDIELATLLIKKTVPIKKNLWETAAGSCSASIQNAACQLVLPALNNMFDVANTRVSLSRIHPPLVVFFLLIGVALLSSLLAGYELVRKEKGTALFLICYAAIMTVTIYIIIDLEYPRLGFIRVDSDDTQLVELQAMIHKAIALP